jgi:phosphatidylglycerol lysyltransferase
VATLAETGTVGRLVGLSVSPLRLAAVALLASTVGALILCETKGRRWARGYVRLPSATFGILQIALTAVDLIAAGAALWVLLPGGTIDFVSFIAVYTVGIALGVLSHVPGGLGVFEAVVFFALGHKVPADQVAASLLAYRGVYFVLPLLLSAGLLAVFELRLVSNRFSWAGQRVLQSAAQLSPTFLGVITFAAGVMLVLSGATPVFDRRLAILAVKLPLWILEASNFLGSLVGVLLLFVARGLFQRLDGAWWVALLLATGGLALSLAKGLAYTEASLLAFLILLLVTTRRQFARRASMLSQPLTLGWFAAVGLVLGASIWLLLFAFRDVAYARDLWWQFEFDAQAPRALRATLGMCVLALAIGVWQLLRLPVGRARLPGGPEIRKAAAIINDQERADALLALMRDKCLLFSSSGSAFLMFGKRGRSWIALFDPVGPQKEWPELISRFVELASSHGGRAAFYQVRPESLPLYLEAGLKIMKLGEEARIPLQDFSLEGPARSNLRYALKRGERDGLVFELLSPEEAGPLMPTLEAISAGWLAHRKATEKGFSVAAFEPGFVAAQAVAVVRERGRPVAFATLMTTGLGHEATVGLMRHTADTPVCAMEFLFTKLILSAKIAGVRTLSLGMAPLSGVEPSPLSSRWHWLARLVRRHGGMVYNFQGIRLFKGKFHPNWEPRYLAASGSIGPFVALADVVALAASGLSRTAAA